jgi:hypothetical protein
MRGDLRREKRDYVGDEGVNVIDRREFKEWDELI